MKIKVTKDCIENSIRKDSHHCMIADAIHKANKDAKYVSVDLQSIQWSDPVKGVRYIVLTPPKAQKAIVEWDQGKNVKPFMFTVHPESGLIKKIGWAANHPNTQSRKGKKYNLTGKTRKHRMVRHREFGIKMFD